ncbi:hypothetical protein SOVF_191220 [Spinacia oleracea]|nr:hypothetical protein SOVF_191220 [Spinacia oleracea]
MEGLSLPHKLIDPVFKAHFGDFGLRKKIMQAEGSKVLLNAPVAALQRKHCPQNNTQPSPKQEVIPESFQLPTDVLFHCRKEKVKNVNNERSCTTIGPWTSMDLQKHLFCQSSKIPLLRSLNSGILPSKLSESPPRPEHLLAGGSSPYSLCISGVDDGQTSPSSVVSVATDLGLKLFSQASKQQKKAYEHSANNTKELFKALFERVGRQCEALRIISQILAHSWTSDGRHQKSGLRGDIWLNFSGPDIFGKRKTAMALAEILYGSKKNFIHVDLCSSDMIFCQKTVLGYQIVNGAEARSRGKTIVDHIAEELRKTPSCVVLFENVHSADPLLQRSLLQAIKVGKFSDSHGREVATNNRIFVLTSISKENNSTLYLSEKPLSFPEERIGRAKGYPLQIVVKGDEDYTLHETKDCQIFLNKRKLNGSDEKTEQLISMDHVKRPHKGSNMSLDLNLPAETSEADNTNIGETDDAEYLSERSDFWLEDFSDQISKFLVKLDFDPFDYETLATKILKLVHSSFNDVIESKCLLEIEPKVLDQIIMTACLCDGDKEVKDWIDQVLSKGFAEAQKRYQLTANSTVMIATCEAQYMEEQVHEACLPSKIILA